MGEVTDAVGIQFRLLNTSRGPAVWSPRAQCDKQQYRQKMREMLESEPNLKIKQAEVAELIVESQVSSESQQHLAISDQQLVNTPVIPSPVEGSVVVLETGTRNLNFLPRSRRQATRWPHRRRAGHHHHHRHISQRVDPLRRAAISRRTQWRTGCRLLGESLKALGLRGCRLKTGTPPRLDGRSIDWSKFKEQPGDADPTPSAFAPASGASR